jgi:biotin transport system substrate-specific component
MKAMARALRLTVTGERTDRLIGFVFFTLATGLAAFVRIPLPWTPVPITAQTLVVLAAGLALGGRLAALTQVAYLILGCAGLAWFAGGHVSAFYFLPTAGYLVAFPLAAAVASLARGEGAWRYLWVIAADLLILGSGVLWLALSLKIGFGQALFLGALPFIPGNALKVGLAIAGHRAWQHLRRVQ